MPTLRSSLLVFTLSCSVAHAAALVPVPDLKTTLPAAGLELNRGQAKAEILFLSRGGTSLAVTAGSILYSPLGVRLSFLMSNSDPAVSFLDPLPGVANSFTGADTRKWVTGIPRYATAHLAEIYPGTDGEYVVDSGGQLTLRLLFRPGIDPKPVVFEIAKATSIEQNADGSIFARLGTSKLDPRLGFVAPIAFQETASGRVSRTVRFEVQSATRFGLLVAGRDSTLPLQIEMKLGGTTDSQFTDAKYTVDAAGNTFIAAMVPDAAGKDATLPIDRWEACGTSIGYPIACSDVAVYKYSIKGVLSYVTYLAGSTQETAGFLQFAPDGGLVLAGTTNSADFPVTSEALQPAYAGPGPGLGSPILGDLFAVRLDSATGLLRASTFLGGPNGDSMGDAALGADGSLYFFPKWLGRASARMPVTRGSLQADCADPCPNGYAAHLSPSLDRLLYGTYLPGGAQATAKLHSDGSLYYAGTAGPGFPTTPTAYQPQAAGKEDGIVARLDPSGSRLLFATYVGGAETDWILRIAVAPDGSVWAAVTSFVQCCINLQYSLVRLDAKGERLLAEQPISVGELAVDRDGNLIAVAFGNFTAGPDAFQASSCAGGPAYIKLNPSGGQLFATYLPSTFLHLDGTSDRGLPLLLIGDSHFQVVESQSMGVFAGCVVDAASFGNADTLSPGAIVTLFGSRMGPREGIGYQLADGHVPTTLGGTQVLVDGEPAPILFSSYWQLNVILPYSLQVGTRPKIQVLSAGVAGNELGTSRVYPAGISLFRMDASPGGQAAALNEDGTLNSPKNPAKKRSRVVLFGTGGGPTIPPSTAGEVTPLLPRSLQYGAQVQVRVASPIVSGLMATVEYAGAAPGLVAGVTQINIKLPDVIPDVEGYPRGTVPLLVTTTGSSFYPGLVTVAVEVD